MKNEEFIVDLHCHPNLKAFNSGHPEPTVNMWDKIIHNTHQNKFAEQIEKQTRQVLKESQSNLYALAEGNVRLFNVSLYPIEKGFLHLRDVPQTLIGAKQVDILQEVITGFDKKRIQFLKKDNHYFNNLIDEYNYVVKGQGKSPDGKYSFSMAANYEEVASLLAKKNTLVGIMSIEGAHVLLQSVEEPDEYTFTEFKAILSERIRTIKQWKYPPFTVNLAHHFWNQLSGHATSFKMPISAIIKQKTGKNKGITPLGWHVIREFLSKENGKRILIDTKHMSAQARKEYYTFIQNYNFINTTDTIPVVFSHAGMNGFQTLESSIQQNDVPRKARQHRLYKWSINVCNEEARAIHQSRGLIGLMMDKGNLGGMKTIRQISAITDLQKQKDEFCKIFWDNAFQIVKAIDDKSGWDVISLGSDYEGTITHMDPYEGSAKLTEFENDLRTYLEKTKYKNEYWFDYTPTQLVRKIMQENAIRFYKEFFV